MRIGLLLLTLLIASCGRPTLSVQSGTFTRRDLASSHVGTPDPDKQKPVFGQRLYISWNVKPQEFTSGPLELQIDVRLKKGGTLSKTVLLDKASGKYIFPIVADDYTKRGGILSYKVVLLSDGKKLSQSRHKFWVEEIQFSE